MALCGTKHPGTLGSVCKPPSTAGRRVDRESREGSVPGVSSEHNQQTKKSITGSGGVREPPRAAAAGPRPSVLSPEPQFKFVKL